MNLTCFRKIVFTPDAWAKKQDTASELKNVSADVKISPSVPARRSHFLIYLRIPYRRSINYLDLGGVREFDLHRSFIIHELARDQDHLAVKRL
jgi:hypothetical protein